MVSWLLVILSVIIFLMFGNKNLDFLAVGDITTDAFIRLSDAGVLCDEKDEHCNLCVRYGDKVPYEFVEIVRAVGNAPNASVSASRLGLSSGLVTNLGEDENGRECLAKLAEEKIDNRFIKIHKGVPTNYHYVLWYEADRTILIKHEKYDYKFPDIANPKWLYLSSLGGGTENYHEEIAKYLEKHSEIKLVFQPGTFQLNLGLTRLEKLLKRCELFVANKEEVQKILSVASDEINNLFSGLKNLGIKTALITDGPKGAYYSDGQKCLFSPPYPDPKPPYDRTGAGDAYGSTFVSALALGKSSEEALRWAGVNAMSVVQEIGAQKGLLSQKQIEEFLKKAPADYRPKKI